MVTTIEDLRQLAKKRVPKMFYEYATAGSWTEATLRANTEDYDKILFRQRIAVDMSNRTTESCMIGEKVSMPVALAPIGLSGMQCADGEVLAAKAANKFGVPFTLSTMSICSIEDVANSCTDPFWFQLYVMRDHKFSKALINRAKAAGCSALMLTLDLQLMGQRHCDIKNGLSAPPKMGLKNLFEMAKKPSWCYKMLKTNKHNFGNIIGHAEGVTNMSSLSAWTSEQFDLSLNWDDVARIRDWWGGKFILKGIMDPEDATNAVKAGADAIIVSNHGGRQLDSTHSSISALPQIKSAVNNATEVWVDGGITTGQDVLKALALGANGTLIGKAFIFGLGAMGQIGVTRSLEIIQKELDMTMALCGRQNLNKLNREILSKCPF